MASRLKWLALLGAVVATGAAACSRSGRPDFADTSLGGSGAGGSNSAEGTACTSVGATQTCGSVKEVVDNNVVCSMGYQICGADMMWSACQAERVITKSLNGLDIQGYGDAGGCADPCTGGCSTTVDSPNGLVLPTGLTNDGGGLTISPSVPPANTCVGLTVAPVNPTITVTSSSTLTTKQFTSTLVPAGCNPSAPAPLWYTDKFDVAQMGATTPGLLTVAVPIAGPVNVSAALGTFTATTPANVVVNIAEKSVANPPPPLAALLNFPVEVATDPVDTNLEVLYPYQDTVFPLGLTAPLIQWRNNGVAATGGVEVMLQYPPGSPIFSIIELTTETMAAPVPLRAAQPRYAVPQNQWFALEQTVNRNRATYGDAARILIRRRVGSTTYLSKYVDVHFAPGQLKGKVYYNSYGTALANNYGGAQQSAGGAFPSGNFGAATLAIVPGGTQPVLAAGSSTSSGCTVCHTASADGATLISAQNGSSAAYLTKEWTLPGTAAGAGVQTVQTGAQLVFAGINPTSTRILSSAGAFSGDSTSRLFDITGNLISGANVPAALKAGFPSFSPDGTKVAFTFRGGSASPLSTSSGDGSTLSMMTFDGNKTFSAFRNLTTPSLGPTIWPSFLPTNDAIVYQIETRTSPDGGYSMTRHDCECGGSYSGATGELWWVTTAAVPVASRLSRLNGYDMLGAGALPATPATGHANYLGTNGPAGPGFYEQRYNYEPTVLPKQIGGYSWVIFTSRRAYGNVATINPYASDPRYDDISIDPTPKKLWIAALDGSPTAGIDPSHPAFYLPGQELIAGNSRGVFALDSCHPAVSGTATSANLCDSDLDCCNAPGTAACVLDPPPLASPPVKHCVSAAANVCRNVGESCLTTSNCCNAASGGVCAAGVCALPPAYYLDQTYTRDYTASCLPGYTVRWGLFDWQSKTPGDSKIVFSAQVSTDGTTFTPATPVTFATASGADVTSPSWATSGTNVSDALGEPKSGSNADKKLRITMALKATTDKGSTPTLIDWRQSIICIPSE